MANTKISLPGSEPVTLAGQAVEKLIREGDGDAALLYLYVLKTHGMSTADEAASALDKSAGWVASAMAALSRMGLVELENNTGPGTGEPEKKPPPPEPEEASRRYTMDEIKNELSAGSDFSAVFEETQRSLGKILSPDELLRLFGIYDALRLPPEVILQLITYCINECRLSGGGRAPTMRFIEKAAYAWEREGIMSLERAEEYIKTLEERRSVQGEIKRTLQIRDRELSATERRFVDGWIEMGFKADTIAIAYDKTVVKTGKLTWGYMDSILKNWHGRGIHTVPEIQAKDKMNDKSAVWGNQMNGARKFGAPNQADLDRMQRLIDKIKDE